MRGRLGYDKWYVVCVMGSDYMAQRTKDGKLETVEFQSHCLACAKVDILAKCGGKVDLRGWHKSPCGLFLLAMATLPDVGEEEE